MCALVMTATSFSPDIVTFCVLRFLSGFGSCGLFLTLFVWGMIIMRLFIIGQHNIYSFIFRCGVCWKEISCNVWLHISSYVRYGLHYSRHRFLFCS